MDEENKNDRVRREAASWNASALTVPAIIAAVILLMVGSTVLSKMAPAPTPTPSPSPEAASAPPPGGYGAAARSAAKMNDPAFMRKWNEKSKKLGGDFKKLTPAEQKELNEATENHGEQFFQMVGKRGGPPVQ